MPRHKFTKAERIRGIEKALASKKTPARFRPALRKTLARLKGKR
jgi:hypothetical protein